MKDLGKSQELFSQRWFPGYHFDIGGDKNQPLNNFALTWMLTQAATCGLPLSGGLPQNFDPGAPKGPQEYLTTKLWLTCDRSQMPEAKLVENEISPEQLRRDITALAVSSSAKILEEKFATQRRARNGPD